MRMFRTTPVHDEGCVTLCDHGLVEENMDWLAHHRLPQTIFEQLPKTVDETLFNYLDPPA